MEHLLNNQFCEACRRLKLGRKRDQLLRVQQEYRSIGLSLEKKWKKKKKNAPPGGEGYISALDWDLRAPCFFVVVFSYPLVYAIISLALLP